jgi:hypothetical protein
MRLWLAVSFLILSSLGNAHPVTYKDGVSLVSNNASEMNEILLTYSFTSNFALAGTYLRDSTSEFYIPRFNLLLKRWNNENSQGNIYLSAGSGIEKYATKNYAVNLFEFSADWESRKYYLDFDHLYLSRSHNKNILIPDQHYNFTKIRAGTAPFLADYTDSVLFDSVLESIFGVRAQPQVSKARIIILNVILNRINRNGYPTSPETKPLIK